MTDIIEVAKKCGATKIEAYESTSGNGGSAYLLTESELQAFADHYRKEGAEDGKRLDFILSNSAFIVTSNTDAGGKAYQLLTQNEDEEYLCLHNEDSFFTSERLAIDAAIFTSELRAKGE